MTQRDSAIPQRLRRCLAQRSLPLLRQRGTTVWIIVILYTTWTQSTRLLHRPSGCCLEADASHMEQKRKADVRNDEALDVNDGRQFYSSCTVLAISLLTRFKATWLPAIPIDRIRTSRHRGSVLFCWPSFVALQPRRRMGSYSASLPYFGRANLGDGLSWGGDGLTRPRMHGIKCLCAS